MLTTAKYIISWELILRREGKLKYSTRRKTLFFQHCTHKHNAALPSAFGNLRADDWKYRKLVDKSEKSDFFIFCQKKPFGELFMKIQVKLFKDFLFSRNLEKREIPGSDLGVRQFLLEKSCAFLTLACKKLQNRINTIFWTSIELCLFMRKM